MFKFADLPSEQMKFFFAKYAYETLGGYVMVPPSEEIERIVKENNQAAKKLNPAHRYMEVYKAGSWDFPRDKNGNILKKNETGDWKSIMTARENVTRRIVNSAPERMIGM